MRHARKPGGRAPWRRRTAGAITVGMLLVGAEAVHGWQASLDGIGQAMDDSWREVVFHPSGDLIVSGWRYATRGDDYDCTRVLSRLARSDGSIVWSAPRRIHADHPALACFERERVLIDPNGDVVVGRGGVVAKHSAATGELVWRVTLGSFPYDGPHHSSIALDPKGDVLFGAGLRRRRAAADHSEMVVAKIDGASGALAWRKRLTGTYSGSTSRENFASAVASDAAGDVLLLGQLVDALPEDDSGLSKLNRRVAMKLSGADGSERWRVDSQGARVGDEQRSLVVDANGDLLHLTEGGQVLKRSGQTGERLWRYGPPVVTPFVGRSIVLSADGHVIAGWDVNEEHLAASGSEVLVARVDAASGQESWHARVERGEGRTDSARGLAIDSAGDVRVAVLSEVEPNRYDFLVVGLDAADGAEQWRFNLDGPESRMEAPPHEAGVIAGALSIDGDQIAAVGSVGRADGVDSFDGFVVFLASDGTELWRRTSSEHYTSTDLAYAVAVLPDDDVAAAGESTNERGMSVFAVHRFDSASGGVVWSSELGEGRATSLVSDAAGDVIAAGVLGDIAPVVVAKLAGADGAEQWRFSEPNTVEYYESDTVPLGVAPNGDIFLAVSRATGNRQDDAFAYRVHTLVYRLAASDGRTLWRAKLARRQALSLAVDQNGDVLLRLARGTPDWRAEIVKLAGTTGERSWTAAPRMYGFSRSLAVAPSGDVIVSGNALGAAPIPAVIVAALDGPTGKAIWRERLGWAHVAHLATTPLGDVLAVLDVAGSSSPVTTRALKLDGATGTRVWLRDLDARAELGACAASVLASDPIGNLLLGGCDSDGGSTGFRFEVTALAASDGRTLWGRAIDGELSGLDSLMPWQPPIGVLALTTDAVGNVVAAGMTADEVRGQDFTVVKWGADGSDELAPSN